MNAVYFSNRSFSYLKIEQYGAALEDATKSIEIDKNYAKVNFFLFYWNIKKGYYRKGSANLALGKYKEALKDFKKVVQIYPRNKEAQEKLKQCEKIVRKIAFEDAIKTENNDIKIQIDYNSIEVESTYEGPHLPNPITLDFIKQLIEYFKNQKKLHIKYPFMLIIISKLFF